MLDGILPKFGMAAIDHLDRFTRHPNLKRNEEAWVANIKKWAASYEKDAELISLEEAKRASRAANE
jgi:hypothetical protein